MRSPHRLIYRLVLSFLFNEIQHFVKSKNTQVQEPIRLERTITAMSKPVKLENTVLTTTYNRLTIGGNC